MTRFNTCLWPKRSLNLQRWYQFFRSHAPATSISLQNLLSNFVCVITNRVPSLPEFWQILKVQFYLNHPQTKYEPRHDKTNKMAVRPAQTQISLGIRPVWSESSLSPWRKLWSLATHWTHSEDSDQTGRMPRLIWFVAGRTLILLVLSCRGSYMPLQSLSATKCFRYLHCQQKQNCMQKKNVNKGSIPGQDRMQTNVLK